MYKVSRTYKNLRFSGAFLTSIAFGLMIVGTVSSVNFLDVKNTNILTNLERKVYGDGSYSENLDFLYGIDEDPYNIVSLNLSEQILMNEINGQASKDSYFKMMNSSNLSKQTTSSSGGELNGVNPKISSGVLSQINGKLSSYTTTFKSSSKERATNVELSAQAINGTILMPGESFSFNKTVGPRTRERGYKDAAIIVGNVYESGLGGGICQTSSTLHQAVVRAGIVPTQRRNHSLPTSYMPLGFDAVVAWGSLDYVFKNPYDFPILIDVSTTGRTLTVSIYGDVTKVDKTYSTVSEAYESVPYTTKKVKDNTLSKGKEVVTKNGVNGTKTKVYIVTKDKYTGKVLDKKLMWDDYYVPQQKIVNVGTK